MPTPFQPPSDRATLEHNRGLELAQVGQTTQAIECFRRAIAVDPLLFAAHANLGPLLAAHGFAEEALSMLERALQLKPENPSVHLNLANLLAALGQLDQARDHCRRSLELRPAHAQTLNALGNVLKDKGMLDEAIDAYRQATLLRPDLPQPASNLLYAMHFQFGQTPQSILNDHRVWQNQFAACFKSQWSPHQNLRDPHRRLRVGYVSPDFREHPVGRFILALLQQHDRSGFEIFCYANMQATDSMTDRIRSHCDVWRDISGMSDEKACEVIRADAIDVLVDLTMHMQSNRLFVFARKPAPVQVTYLAYCSTTGLEAMDYRLTDPFLDPVGNDEFYAEQSVRLPRTYWCYQANDAAPAVNPLPASTRGHVTFACLNNFCKVTPATLAAWATILKALPTARLILHAGEGDHRQRVREQLGIESERLHFVGRAPMRTYFERYHEIDIALDPFPYTGGTTSFDALWMGVPVVSLAGQTAVSRSGLSILSNIGHGEGGHAEWVADSIDAYVRNALELANDLPQLSKMREALRGEMLRSPLMDAPQFARDVEAAYRGMWQRWCGGRKNPRGAGG